MTRKNKAQDFLSKYQLGGDFDPYQQQNPYNYSPDLGTAQQEQIVQLNDPKSQSAYQSLDQVKKGFDPIPFIGPAINLGIGVKNIFDSFKERKRQKQFQRAYQKDLDRRLNESKANDFYHTPYEFNWSNNAGSFEEGGSIPDRYKNMGFNRVGQKKDSTRDGKKWMVLAKKGDDYKVVHGGYEGMKDYTQHHDEGRRERFWDRMGGKDSSKAKDPFSPLYWHKRFGTWQQGGMTTFFDYYNQREGQNQMIQNQMEDYYVNTNAQMEQAWKQKQSSGIQDAISGTIGLASNFAGLPFQEGGELSRIRSRRERYVDGPNGTERKVTIPTTIVHKRDSIDRPKPNPLYGELFKRDGTAKSKSKDRFVEHQEGGEYNAKTDLYSQEYDPNVFLGIVKDDLQIAEQEDKIESQMESWLFDDEDYDYNEVNNNYFSNISQASQASSPSYPSILDVVSKIGQQESAGKYDAINPYSGAVGKYQFVPSHWAGQIKSFLGLPDSYSKEQVMEVFKKNPQYQEDFMEYVTTSIYKPEAQKLMPLAQKYGMDEDKVVRMLHYRGIGDTRRRLKEGDFSVSQEEKSKYKNPDILTYLNK